MDTNSRTGDEAKQKTPRIVVIGASCAGLFVGIGLTRMGYDVDIIESAVSSARNGTAAGIGLGGYAQQFLKQHDRLSGVPFSLCSECFNVLDGNLQTTNEILHGYELTSWESMYYRLRANFDRLPSSYCPQPPSRQTGDGKAAVHPGVRALSVHNGGSSVRVKTVNNTTRESDVMEAEYVVVADGGNSTIRQQLEPTVVRQDAGYMVWRGTAPSKHLAPTLKEKLNGRSAVYAVPGQKSYAVIYTIPGEDGALSDEKKLVNLVWYHWPVSRAAVLTGVDGHCHRTTLPKGHMRSDVWTDQITWARVHMHPDIASLVAAIEQPFASVISSTISTRATYFEDKLFIVGDALAQVQPNTGQSTNLAAMAALRLVDVLSSKATAEAFETVVLGEAREVNTRAIALGSSYMK